MTGWGSQSLNYAYVGQKKVHGTAPLDRCINITKARLTIAFLSKKSAALYICSTEHMQIHVELSNRKLAEIFTETSLPASPTLSPGFCLLVAD